MKRFLSVFLTLALLFPLAPKAGAAETEELVIFDFHALATDSGFAPSLFALPETGAFDPENPSYGAQLEDELALRAYQALEENLVPGATRIPVDTTGFDFDFTDYPAGGSIFNSTDWVETVGPALRAAIAAYVFDHPESQFSDLGYAASSAGTVSFATACPPSIPEQDYDPQGRKAALDAVVEEFADNFDTTLPVVQQYKAIYDYVCNSTSYNDVAAGSSAPTQAHTVYGLLVDGDQVVCEGYAKTFKVLCDAVGLPCILVVGESSTNGYFTGRSNHMWNAVAIDGAWYGVDATWDDQDDLIISEFPDLTLSLVSYDYFLNNTYFQDGSADQDHRSTGNIYYQGDWPMTFALPTLAEDRPVVFATDKLTLNMSMELLSIPERLWLYTIGSTALKDLTDITLNLTRDTQLDHTFQIPAGYTYTLDSTLSTARSPEAMISRAEGFEGPLFNIAGTLRLDDIALEDNGLPFATLDGGTLVDLDDPNLDGYLDYSGDGVGTADGYEASYDADGRMLSLTHLGSYQLTQPGIYLSTPPIHLTPKVGSAVLVKQFFLDPVTFAPISDSITP